MVVVDYAEHFWGDKHHGYQVLYGNLKRGEEAVQELAQFLKDRISFEEEYCKYLSKGISRSASLNAAGGAFAESWLITKSTLELLAEVQTSFLATLQQLLKDIMRYHDDLVRSRKRVKEQDVVDAVNLMQTTTTCLQKSKETYMQRCTELERLKKENATSKEIVKAESKVVKSRDEYRSYVDKYGRVRDEFEEKMVKASHSFQAHDQAYLQQMKTFLASFACAIDDTTAASSQVCSQYRESIDQIDIEDIMLKFVEAKGTGKERPEFAIFEELDCVGDCSVGGSASAPSSSNSSAIVHPLTQPEPVPPTAHDLLNLDSNVLDAWNDANNVNTQSSPVASDSGSSTTAQPAVSASSSILPSAFSASLGRQKLALWLPGKRKKYSSQSSLPGGDTTPNDFSHSHSESSGFLKKYRSKTKKSNTDLTATTPDTILDHATVDDARSTASSSKSDDKTFTNANGTLTAMDLPLAPPPPLPAVPPPDDVDDEGYTIRPVPPPKAVAESSRWSSCTDSSDEDEEVIRAAKLRHICIKPLNESNVSVNASVDELRDAIGHISLNSSLNRSNTFDNDPWTATSRTPFSLSLGGNVRPLRAAFTGDEHLRKKNNDLGAQLPFSLSMSGGSMARARPRSNTPTFGSSCMTLHPVTSQTPSNATFTRKEWMSSEGLFSRSDSVNSIGQCGPSDSPFSASTSNLFSAAATISEQRVPVAMAVNEYIHSWFKGSDITKTSVRVFGTVLISFPSASASVLTDLRSDLEPLRFRLTNAEKIKAVLPNKQLLSTVIDAFAAPHTYCFDRALLAKWLTMQTSEKPTASFYNAEVLRYELRDAVAPPLLLTSYWKMETDSTHLRIDYRLNTDSTVQTALLNITFTTKVNGGVSAVIADPKEEWSSSDETLCWKLTELSRHGECGGSLKARLTLSSGPSNAVQTFVQFQTSDASISGASVAVDSDDAYHLSMVRRKVLSGKYFCDPEIRK